MPPVDCACSTMLKTSCKNMCRLTTGFKLGSSNLVALQALKVMQLYQQSYMILVKYEMLQDPRCAL
eukprot:5721542-Amphidinium_carterae.1